MDILLYNTLWRAKQPFVARMDTHPNQFDHVLMYTCGPTVYGDPHIGNLRAFTAADITRRLVHYIGGYPIKHALNLTDVWHLTDDGSDGEDKMEKWSRKEWLSARDIAEKYINNFHEYRKELHLLEHDVYPRATDFISEQVEIVQTMRDKWLTYEIENDGIYCDTSKIDDYGKLLPAGHLEGLEQGHRVEDHGKRNLTDFALRKFSPKDEHRQMERLFSWPRHGQLVTDEIRETITPLEEQTRGFPGRHIECSAMSRATLGDYLDIHTGGIDHIPVHHTNEIAQSEYGFCDCSGDHANWTNYWMHNQFLNINNQRIAKSTGNTVCFPEIIEQWFSGTDLRYFFLHAHYRSFQDFTRDHLTEMKTSRKNLRRKISWLINTHNLSLFHDLVTARYGHLTSLSKQFDGIHDNVLSTSEWQSFFTSWMRAICDDVNMPELMWLIHQAINKTPNEEILSQIYWLDTYILDCDLFEPAEEVVIPPHVAQLAQQRRDAKQAKDRTTADRLRDEITATGFSMLDGKDGYEVKKNG